MTHYSFSTEGVILSRKNYGEADRLLIIYTKHYGKIFLLAKGVRKPNSRKRGHIEIFSKVKFSFTKNDHFVLMNEAELIDGYESVRVNLKKTSLAYYFVELISKVTQEDEKNTELYELIIKYFDILKNFTKLKNLRLDFIKEVLEILGYWPREKDMPNPDKVIESVLERQINSKRVGERMLKQYLISTNEHK